MMYYCETLELDHNCVGGLESILYQVKDRHSIAYRRKKRGPIRTEKQVSLAVDSP
jgi:hypothetical protein